MGTIHALIGVAEGLITVGALAFVLAARKDLLKIGDAKPASDKAILIGGSVIALALAVLSPLASANPDGLEWVAEEHGFLDTAQEALYSIIPDYAMPGISDPGLATIVAGIVGVVIVFGVAYGVARAERRTSTQESSQR
jgi:cobalt/nickel transport system permease protein